MDETMKIVFWNYKSI